MVIFISPEERGIRERDASTRYVRDQRSKDVTALLAMIDSLRADPLRAAAPAMLAALKEACAALTGAALELKRAAETIDAMGDRTGPASVHHENAHHYECKALAVQAAIDNAEGR